MTTMTPAMEAALAAERAYRSLPYAEQWSHRHEFPALDVPCFRCCECGEIVPFSRLESWFCDFSDLDEGVICSLCYEEMMGEDL